LKTTHTWNRSLRCTDLGWKIREGGQIDPEQGCVVGELGSGQLHTVPAITGKLDHYIR
jgi:hypothetical protein